jgi:hypothetical protein
MATSTTQRPSPQHPSAATRGRGLSGPALAGLVLILGLALGGLTAYGQSVLPYHLAPLANSTGPWVLVAFGLALLARRRSGAALVGLLTLALLLAGYVLTDWARGYPSSRALIAFWGLACVLVGPVLGVAANSLRHGSRSAAALSAGLLSGVVVGEGVYGLRSIADSTSAPYWWAEIGLGIVLMAALIEARKLGPAQALLTAATATATIAAFVVLYSQDLITSFG